MMKYGSTRYVCEIFDDDGDYYASVDAPTIDECVTEAQSYVFNGRYELHYYEMREILLSAVER